MNLEQTFDRVLSRHDELSAQLSGTGAPPDAQSFVRMSKELAELAPVVTGIKALRQLRTEMD